MNTPRDFDTNEMSYRTDDGIAILSLKAGAFNILTSLAAKQKLLDLLVELDQADAIKGLVLINSDDYPGDEKYRTFLRQVMLGGSENVHEHGLKVARTRNAISQLVLVTAKFGKPMVAGVQGRITGEFFGSVLPFDYRFATDDTVLMFPHVPLGFPPSGALAYYLNRFVGPGRTSEILLSGRDMSATDAEKLGLVNAVTGREDLLERCVEILAVVCRSPSTVLRATRSMLHPEVTEIEAYLRKAFDTAWKSLYSMGKVDAGW